jgi:hypothetical protein
MVESMGRTLHRTLYYYEVKENKRDSGLCYVRDLIERSVYHHRATTTRPSLPSSLPPHPSERTNET